jgi:predicted ribosomally synthesized peptide with SipW-like signal peptide
MLRKNTLLILGLIVVLAIGATGAFAQFTDTETSTDNSFEAGTMDLTVNGENGTLSFKFSLADQTLAPGSYYDAGTVEVKNIGTVPGRVGLKILNPYSDENGLWEPEIEAGDLDGQEMEFGSYDVNDGDGEFWDSAWIQFYVDGNGDNHYEGGYAPHHDCIIEDGALDKSGYYSFPIDTELMPMDTNTYCTYDWVDLAQDETVDVGVRIYFFSDTGGGPAGGWSSALPPSNMAMSDTLEFDIVFNLTQAP